MRRTKLHCDHRVVVSDHCPPASKLGLLWFVRVEQPGNDGVNIGDKTNCIWKQARNAFILVSIIIARQKEISIDRRCDWAKRSEINQFGIRWDVSWCETNEFYLRFNFF